MSPHTCNVWIKSGFYLYLESFIFSAQPEHYFGISIRQDQLRTETQMNEKHFLCGVAKINPTFSVFMVSHVFPCYSVLFCVADAVQRGSWYLW